MTRANDARARAMGVRCACLAPRARAARVARARRAWRREPDADASRAGKKRHTDARARRDTDDERTDADDDVEGGAMKVSFKTLCVRRCARRRDACDGCALIYQITPGAMWCAR